MRAITERTITADNIEDFLEKAQVMPEFDRAIEIFIEEFKELLKKNGVELKGEALDEIIEELEEMDATICEELLYEEINLHIQSVVEKNIKKRV